MSQPAVAVENLCKIYGQGSGAIAALSGVSLSVAAGEIYGLLGRNGAGKTTLVKTLLDIVRPTSGDARILGIPSRSHKSRIPVGYLPEDHRFPDYRTGEGVLHYYAGLSGVSNSERRKRVPELLNITGLTQASHRKIRTYSKGMKQRLGLAQALVHDPQVIFLDEPTDGVDPVGRAQIRDVLHGLKDRGKTIFLNSHLLSEVERICDRMAIMEKGKLVREGTLESLTRGACVFTIGTVPALDSETLSALAPLAHSVTMTAETCAVELNSAVEIDRIIDILRARGYGLRRLEEKRSSLEDVFMQAVGTAAPAKES